VTVLPALVTNRPSTPTIAGAPPNATTVPLSTGPPPVLASIEASPPAWSALP
jgi:hypothetical protein